MSAPERVTVYTIPSHRWFADALAGGLIARFGKEPLGLAKGRILLPNNRAVRAVTEAFVRASGAGLLLPRLVPVGDPELDERLGGALDRIDGHEPVPKTIDTTERLLKLAAILRTELTAENLRLSADLARTLDALLIEEIDPHDLKNAVSETSELARHWEHSLERLQLIYEAWPQILAERGAIDLAERRNRLLHRLAGVWKNDPPQGFTVAAGITTAAPAVAALVARVARIQEGMVVLPGLWLENIFPAAEWDALGPDENGKWEETHPQSHPILFRSGAGTRQCNDCSAPFAQMGKIGTGGTSFERNSVRRAARSRGRSASDRPYITRSSGNARKDRGTDHSGSPACSARLGAPRTMGH